jgi:hypothetical protein
MQAIDRSAEPGAGGERPSEIRSESWELAKYKEIVNSYENTVASALALIKKLTKERDNAVKGTAKRCVKIAERLYADGYAAAGEMREEFGL